MELKNQVWFEKPLKGELKLKGGGVEIIICPTKNHAKSLKDIDVIHLKLNNAKGEVKEFWMTPDEAAEISSLLSSAVYWWLNGKFKPYINKFGKRRNNLINKLK